MKTLYEHPVSQKPKEPGQYLTNHGIMYWDEKNWNAWSMGAWCECSWPSLWYTDQPPAQLATSKSLDEKQTALEVLTKHEKLNNGYLTGWQQDWVITAMMEYASQFQQQPHPQDSSGEVEAGSLPCDICGDSICQCSNTPPASESRKPKQKVKEVEGLPLPEPDEESKKIVDEFFQSESLEQAAEIDKPNDVALISQVYWDMWKNGEVDDKFSKSLEAAYFFIKGFKKAQSTQQQKPMGFVLPDDEWINIRLMSKFPSVDGDYSSQNFVSREIMRQGFTEMRDEIRNRMSAANGIDLNKVLASVKKIDNKLYTLVETKNGLRNDIVVDAQKAKHEAEQLIQYLTEQSQQQNKGK